MKVIAITWELRIPGCRSLKEKRSTVRALRDRLRHRFNVSVSETGFQDIHDRAQLTVAFVASDSRLAESMASRVDALVSDNGRALVLRRAREDF
jgi:uncharacterized protein